MAPVGATERARERSMVLGCVLDLGILIPFFVVAAWADSLTLLSEAVRGSLLLGLDAAVLVVLRRIHRRRFGAYDYGAAKIETFSNLIVGLSMILAAAWLLDGALHRLRHPPDQEDLGLAVAAALAVVNLGLNAVVLRAVWKAGRDGGSIILAGQIRTRLTKLVASFLATAAIGVNAWWGDYGPGHYADSVGSILVVIAMVMLGVGMWREALPHLLDRSLDEERQALINRALAARFHDYASLGSVRSRILGSEAWVEVTLGFEPARRMEDVQSAMDAVAEEVARLIPGARVTVIPYAVRP